MRLTAILILLYPLVEIAGFIVIGDALGVFGTLGLLIAAAFLGILIVRIQGFGLLQRIRGEMDAGRVPGRELAHGAMIAAAGVLFLLPGFVSDLAGLLLLLPPLRDFLWRFLSRRVTVVSGLHPGAARGNSAARTIDLEPGEYGSADSPWRER